MTPAARRAEMAGNIAVLRERPPCELADHAREITGRQWGEVTCWRCRCDQDPADVQPDGFLFACRDQDGCNRRAAEFAETEDAERFYGAMAEYEDEEFAYEAAQGRADMGGI